MGPYYYWLSTDARHQELMRGWNETKAAAMAETANRAGELARDLLWSFAGPLHWLVRRRREAVTRRELTALDDRLLADIGLSRGAIREAARRPDWFRPRLAGGQPSADVLTLPQRMAAPGQAPAKGGAADGRNAA